MYLSLFSISMKNGWVDKNIKFTREKQWKYRKIINPIASEIQAALIMHKLKNWNKWQSDTAQLAFDENWKLTERNRPNAPKRWPVDILWKIEDIDIWKIRIKALNKIDSSAEIEESDKKRLKEWINNFILKEFINARKNLESKSHLPNKKFRQYYKELANSLVKEKKLSEKEWVLYREICLSFANILYEKNHNDYIEKNWEISQKWLQYIWRVFLRTIKNIPRSAKQFNKIFHDGDFNFLCKETSEWEPKIWTLDHYVRAIMYLMDSNSFNAYAEGWQEWADERYKTKKSFLNNLYTTLYLKDKTTKWILSDKWIIHKKLAEQWQSSNESLDESNDWDLTSRLKTEASIMAKASWRTKDIKDESWVRATYYWDLEDKEWIKNYIITKAKNYFDKILNITWIEIKSIQADMKWSFVTKEICWEIISQLWEYISDKQSEWINISERTRTWAKKSKIDSVSWIYGQLEHKKPWSWLQQAYNIASWEVQRWANWKYDDFKLIVEYHIDKEAYNEHISDSDTPIDQDVDLPQEISFYSHDNDLDIWNHNFLDLEKNIYGRVKSMNDPQLWKSISLHRLRQYTEIAIKDLSFDIDIYEDRIKRWLLPKPKNDDYKYLKIWWKPLALDWLICRTKENSHRFDELIPVIINYFIKKNKIFYINRKDEYFYWLVTTEQLYDKQSYRIRRFTTSDELRNIALDTKNADHSISIYTDEEKEFGLKNFHMINLWDLGDFINLEESIKK